MIQFFHGYYNTWKWFKCVSLPSLSLSLFYVSSVTFFYLATVRINSANNFSNTDLIDAKPNIHKKERWQTINVRKFKENSINIWTLQFTLLQLQSRADEFVCPPGVDGFYPADDQNCTEDYYYCTVDGTAYLQVNINLSTKPIELYFRWVIVI